MMGYYGYYDGMSFFGPLFMILVWGLIIWAVVMLIRMFSSHETDKHKSEKTDKALDILRERFARGEISKAEFEERFKSLSN